MRDAVVGAVALGQKRVEEKRLKDVRCLCRMVTCVCIPRAAAATNIPHAARAIRTGCEDGQGVGVPGHGIHVAHVASEHAQAFGAVSTEESRIAIRTPHSKIMTNGAHSHTPRKGLFRQHVFREAVRVSHAPHARGVAQSVAGVPQAHRLVTSTREGESTGGRRRGVSEGCHE